MKIEIPAQFVYVASRWYHGAADRLYAVASTGRLEKGNRCPVYDYTDHADRDLKWVYSLWCDLAYDIETARRSCRTALVNATDSDFDELNEDSILLMEFARFADETTAAFEAEFPQLIDWSGE